MAHLVPRVTDFDLWRSGHKGQRRRLTLHRCWKSML